MTEITSWDAVEVRFSEVAEGQNHIRRDLNKLEGAVADLQGKFQGLGKMLKEILEIQLRFENQQSSTSSATSTETGATSVAGVTIITGSMSEPVQWNPSSIPLTSIGPKEPTLGSKISEGCMDLCNSITTRLPAAMVEDELRKKLPTAPIMEISSDCSSLETIMVQHGCQQHEEVSTKVLACNSIPKIHGSTSCKFMYAILSVMHPWCFDPGILSCSISRKCPRNGYAVMVMLDELWIVPEWLLAKIQYGFGTFAEPVDGIVVRIALSVIYHVCFDQGILHPQFFALESILGVGKNSKCSITKHDYVKCSMNNQVPNGIELAMDHQCNNLFSFKWGPCSSCIISLLTMFLFGSSSRTTYVNKLYCVFYFVYPSQQNSVCNGDLQVQSHNTITLIPGSQDSLKIWKELVSVVTVLSTIRVQLISKYDSRSMHSMFWLSYTNYMKKFKEIITTELKVLQDAPSSSALVSNFEVDRATGFLCFASMRCPWLWLCYARMSRQYVNQITFLVGLVYSFLPGLSGLQKFVSNHVLYVSYDSTEMSKNITKWSIKKHKQVFPTELQTANHSVLSKSMNMEFRIFWRHMSVRVLHLLPGAVSSLDLWAATVCSRSTHFHIPVASLRTLLTTCFRYERLLIYSSFIAARDLNLISYGQQRATGGKIENQFGYHGSFPRATNGYFITSRHEFKNYRGFPCVSVTSVTAAWCPWGRTCFNLGIQIYDQFQYAISANFKTSDNVGRVIKIFS